MASKTQPQLENFGSLITYKDGEVERAVGYLMNFEGHGIYDPTLGKVDVTPEQAKIHNEELDEATLKGLDVNCEVGQGGSFYLVRQDGKPVVKSFIGTLISDQCSVNGHIVTFMRNGKAFRGRTSSEHDLFNFKRVA